MATTIAVNAEAAAHARHWLNDLAAARLLATGRTKELPGFDRLAGFVTCTADLSARVRRCQGKPRLRSSRVQPAPLRDG